MHPEPIFTLFGGGVYLYGICLAAGIVACFAFVLFTMDYKNFNEESSNKILLVGIVATGLGVLMAAVFQGVYDVIAGKEFSLSGMTFYGGLIGGVSTFLLVWNLYIYVIAPRAKDVVWTTKDGKTHTVKLKFLQNNMNAGLLDAVPFIPIGIVIAHSLGRLGCFFAGCCHGAETDAWYGIYMYATSLGYSAKVVPTQLFECIFLAVLAIVMAVLYFRFKFNCNLGVYCIGYGIWRFIIEYIRNDYRGDFVQGITPSQFWAIIMVVLGIGYFFAYHYLFKKWMKHPELQPRVNPKKQKVEK